MRHLQEVYVKYHSKGLVILGLNTQDDRQIALEFVHANGVTFPNVLDTSAAARKVDRDYPDAGCPTNYIIDREGRIVDAWWATDPGHRRALAAMQKTGGKLAEAIGQEKARGASLAH